MAARRMHATSATGAAPPWAAPRRGERAWARSTPAPNPSALHLRAGAMVDGAWVDGACGGGPHLRSWRANPVFELVPVAASPLQIELSQMVGNASRLSIGFVLLTRAEYDRRDEPVLVASSKFQRAPAVRVRLASLVPLEPGEAYVVVPCCSERGVRGRFRLSIGTDDVGMTFGPEGSLARVFPAGARPGAVAHPPPPHSAVLVAEGAALSAAQREQLEALVASALHHCSRARGVPAGAGLFEDPEFPLSARALWGEPAAGGSAAAAVGASGAAAAAAAAAAEAAAGREVEWWRPPRGTALFGDAGEEPHDALAPVPPLSGRAAARARRDASLHEALTLLGGAAPQLVRRAIVHSAHAHHGLYVVRLYPRALARAGAEEEDECALVAVDDRLPHDARTGEPLCLGLLPLGARRGAGAARAAAAGGATDTTAARAALWAAILEKAVAKYYGGYSLPCADGALGAHPHAALRLLTGGDARSVPVPRAPAAAPEPRAAAAGAHGAPALDGADAGAPGAAAATPAAAHAGAAPALADALAPEQPAPRGAHELLWVQLLALWASGAEAVVGARVAPGSAAERHGLCAGRVYAVVAGGEVAGAGRLLRLRGRYADARRADGAPRADWHGPWSADDGGRWSARLRQLLRASPADAQSTWLSYEDFLTHFDEVVLAHTQAQTWTRACARAAWDEPARGAEAAPQWAVRAAAGARVRVSVRARPRDGAARFFSAPLELGVVVCRPLSALAGGPHAAPALRILASQRAPVLAEGGSMVGAAAIAAGGAGGDGGGRSQGRAAAAEAAVPAGLAAETSAEAWREASWAQAGVDERGALLTPRAEPPPLAEASTSLLLWPARDAERSGGTEPPAALRGGAGEVAALRAWAQTARGVGGAEEAEVVECVVVPRLLTPPPPHALLLELDVCADDGRGGGDARAVAVQAPRAWHASSERGAWVPPGTDGGPPSEPSFFDNPQYELVVPHGGPIVIELALRDPLAPGAPAPAARPCVRLGLAALEAQRAGRALLPQGQMGRVPRMLASALGGGEGTPVSLELHALAPSTAMVIVPFVLRSALGAEAAGGTDGAAASLGSGGADAGADGGSGPADPPPSGLDGIHVALARTPRGHDGTERGAEAPDPAPSPAVEPLSFSLAVHSAGGHALGRVGAAGPDGCDACAHDCNKCPMQRMLGRLADIESTIDARMAYLRKELSDE